MTAREVAICALSDLFHEMPVSNSDSVNIR